MRTETRSEYVANEAQARAVVATIARNMAHDAERAEWRRVLADRDAKRAHRARRDARRSNPRNAYGRATLAASVATAAGAIVAAILRAFV